MVDLVSVEKIAIGITTDSVVIPALIIIKAI